MTDRRAAYNALMKFYPLTLDDLPDELWHPIKRYENFYHVSNYGRVKSFKDKSPRILHPTFTPKGYLRISFGTGVTKKSIQIHRLVAEAFIPNPDAKPQVNHRDGHPLNNYVGNLEWATNSENQQHAVDTGLRTPPHGQTVYNAKLTNDGAKYIRDNPDNLTGAQLAAKFGVDETTISNVQLGKTYKTAGGNIREPNKQPNWRLPDNVRDEIRRLYKCGVRGYGSYALAEKFGVSATTIKRIIKEGAGDDVS